METYTNFTSVPMNIGRAKSLATLLTACEKNGIEITVLNFYQNGYHVEFEGISGDAILHDGSYGREYFLWESYGMPWDSDDVSVHDAETLVKLISAVLNGQNWEEVEGK